MNFERMNNKGMTERVITLVLGILVGLLLIVVKADLLAKYIFIFLGVLTIFSALPGLFLGATSIHTSAGKRMLTFSLLTLLLGLVLTFYHGTVLLILIGAYLLVAPLVEIFTSPDKKEAFFGNIYRLVLGILFLILGPAQTLDVLFDVAGGVVILLSFLGFFLWLFRMQKHKNTPGNRIFADTTGDGKIDTVFVDTTGDGNADTATDYRDNQK